MVGKISWYDIVDLLGNAKRNVVLIMPAIHEEWVTAIQENEHIHQLTLKICIDNNEDVIRKGYGSVNSLMKLKELNADIKECDGLRVNFINIDNEGFCLFMESRIVAGNPEGYNTIAVDNNAAQTIINQFFPELISSDSFEDVEILSIPLVEEKARVVKESIDKNPPSEPDLRRQINTYTTLFQYAEIHFEGANLQSKTITIPPTALPFKDAELKKRMRTRFNLFTKEQTDKWETLLNMKQKVEELRDKYLTPCKLKRDRSILRKEEKLAFVKEYQELKNASEEAIKKITDAVQSAINESKKILKNELTSFLTSNEPEAVADSDDDKNKKELIDDYVNKIIVQTNIPTAHSLVKNIRLEIQYAELTIEDLNDKPFLEWFKEKGLINDVNGKSLADFKKAFEIRR